MEPTKIKQERTLKQFLFELATNPQLQIKLASLYKDALHRFFVEQGLSNEDAQLLANAQVSGEGKEQLAKKLTTAIDEAWTHHHHQTVSNLARDE